MDRRRDWELFARMWLALWGVALANLAFVVGAVGGALYGVALVEMGTETPETWGASVAVDDVVFAVATGRPLVVGLVALGLAVALVVVEYGYGRRRHSSAFETAPVSPDLQKRMDRLAAVADVPPPTVGVVEDPVANSFAVGRRGDATVVVSTALQSALDDEELDAVLAHELAHVANRDAAVMTVALAPLFFLASVDETLRSGRVAGWAVVGAWTALGLGTYVVLQGVGVVAAVDPVGLAGVALFGVATLMTTLLAVYCLPGVLAPAPGLLSRYREYAADRGAARLTGNPAALASALRTLNGDDRPDDDLRSPPALGALCLLERGLTPGPRCGFPLSPAERTTNHPPVEDRIDRLSTLVAEFEG